MPFSMHQHSTMASISGIEKFDHEVTSKRPKKAECYWACCECGIQANLSVRFNSHCPECSHLRCAHCSVNGNLKLSRDFPASLIECFTYGENYKDLGDIDVNADDNSQSNESLGEISDLSSSSSHSYSLPGSVPSSSAGTPSVSEGHADVQREASETNYEGILSDSGTQNELHVFKVLESRILTTFDDRLDLAAIIIPKIRSLFLSATAGYNTVQNSEDNTATTGGPSKNGKLSSTPSKGESTIDKSSRRKRRRKSNEEDERPRKQALKQFKQPSDSDPQFFACHWHKRDSVKYSASNTETKRYRHCMDLVVPEDFWRIKDHFKSAHVGYQCKRCRSFFREIREQKAHQKAGDCSQNESQSLVEGINHSQWEAMEKVIAHKRKPDVQKWFEIWDILFPNVPRSPHPWKETFKAMEPSNIKPAIIDVQARVERFRRLVEFDKEDQVLSKEDPIPAWCISALERMLGEMKAEEMENSLVDDADRYFDRLRAREPSHDDTQFATHNLESVLAPSVFLEELEDFNGIGFQTPLTLNHKHHSWTPKKSAPQFASPGSSAHQETPRSFDSSSFQSPASSYQYQTTNHTTPLQEQHTFCSPSHFHNNLSPRTYSQYGQSPMDMVESNEFDVSNRPYDTSLDPGYLLPAEWMTPSHFVDAMDDELDLGAENSQEIPAGWNTESSD